MADVSQCRVGICGLGTVASATYNLLTRHAALIQSRSGTEVTVVHVGCRRDHPDCVLSNVRVSRDIFEVVRDPEVDVVLELIGGTDPALDLVREALGNGKHVVTANKALIAEFGGELFDLANANNVSIRYEAAVAGGIPIIKAIREGLAGNEISRVAGIINGTTNFILTEMEGMGNRGFEEVLAEAQSLGYAEADPTFDVEGIDAAHKLTILSTIAFGVPLEFEAMYTEGISQITVADIRFADELGYKIKHLGITAKDTQGVELRVHPTLVPKTSLIAQVGGVMNAVMVTSDAAGETMYYGAGAGGDATGSSVISDVVDLARDHVGIPGPGYLADAVNAVQIRPVEQIESPFYLRLTARDKPGVMASLTSILSSHNISIESLLQRDAKADEVPVVMITNRVKESAMNAALLEITSQSNVAGEITRIRVL
ncbi:MAG: homoserine dehydrogenase [Gammaproteobacteria bacterium]|nr:homoserine dehydrogenase [Gammaproteobacteria bacterium]|tara:strand:- start:11634 stop:12920 length:1287 start_codon:yes stop_codon:yes gene_type:complete